MLISARKAVQTFVRPGESSLAKGLEPYIFKTENYGTSVYHVQHRHAQGSIVPYMPRVYSAPGSTLDPGPLKPGGLGTPDLM